MNNQVNLIEKDRLLAWIEVELAKEYPESVAQYVDGRETVLEILKHRIEQGIFDPDTPPVPTIKPGDKDTANLIADLLFAFINQDAYYPHDFEIKAFEDAITVLRPHFEEINYHPKLFVDHLERMRRAARNE